MTTLISNGEFASAAEFFKDESGNVVFDTYDWSNCRFEHQIFVGIKFVECDFTESWFVNTTFNSCNFVNCNFNKAKFYSFNTLNTLFKGCDFINTHFKSSSINETTLFECLFDNSVVESTRFKSARLRSCNMLNWRVTLSDFLGCKWHDCNLPESKFTQCYFRYERFVGCSYDKAKFIFCRFVDPIFDECVLTCVFGHNTNLSEPTLLACKPPAITPDNITFWQSIFLKVADRTRSDEVDFIKELFWIKETSPDDFLDYTTVPAGRNLLNRAHKNFFTKEVTKVV